MLIKERVKRAWKRGLGYVIVGVVIFIFIDLVQPLEIILKLFLPKEWIFWSLPFWTLFVLAFVIGAIIPLVKSILTFSILGKLIDLLSKKFPFLKIILEKERDGKGLIKSESAPVGVIIFNFFGFFEIYLYGFILGTTEMLQKKGKDKTTVFLHIPTIPFFLTGFPWSANIKNVRKVEILDENITPAMALIRSCMTFRPIAKKVRLKKIEPEKIEKDIEKAKEEAESKTKDAE